MSPDFDVLAVGAGPAGAATALSLALQAPSLVPAILLIDAARHPRPKPCGGVISGRARVVLERLGVDLAALPGLDVTRAQVRLEERRYTRVLPIPARAVYRPDFDAALVARARQLGLAVWESTRLTGLQRCPGGWRVVVQRDGREQIVTARLVVGADGAHGPVRRLAGFPTGGRRARLALVDCESGADDPLPDTMVFELTGGPLRAYFWSFPAVRPQGEAGAPPLRNRGVYHYGRTPPAPPQELLRWHLEAAGARKAGRPVSAAQRLYEPAGPCGGPGVLLVGESLGADPVSGEGIAQSLVQGEQAAAALAEALARGTCDLSGWPTRLARSEGRVLRQHAWIARVAYGPGQRWLTRRLLEAPELGDAVLGRFSGLRLTPSQRRSVLRLLLPPLSRG